MSVRSRVVVLMPPWTENALLLALAAGLLGILQNLLNRSGRKMEVDATSDDAHVKRLGEHLDRLEKAQLHDRRRIDWLEDELWAERGVNTELRHALVQVVDWGESVSEWKRGDRSVQAPQDLDWGKFRKLLESPRPRRPPPVVDD